MIVDRSSGLFLPLNGSDATSLSNASATATVTATATAKSSSNIAPVAAGIAVPLGILLIAALVCCGILFGQMRKLRHEMNAGADRGGSARNYDMAGPSPEYKHVPQQDQSYGSPATAYAHYASPPSQPFPVEAPAHAEVGEADSQPVKGFR